MRRNLALPLCLAAAFGTACEPAADPASGDEAAKTSAPESAGEEDATALPPEGEDEGPAEADSEAPPAEAGEEPEPEVDEGVREPEGYGVFQPPEDPPSEEELVNHALAGYEVVAVYSKPEMDSEKLGFLRIGRRMKVGEKIKSADCAKGWYAIPQGGYACASKGLVVDKKPPYMKSEPPAPRMDQAHPYDWAFVRKWNSPMWWRPPSQDENKRAMEKRAELEALREGLPPPGEEPAAPSGENPPAPEGENGPADPPLPAPEGEPEPAPSPEPEAAPAPAPETDPEPEVEEPRLPLSPAHPWLEKGYFISLAGKVQENGRGFWRTARGAYVAQSDAYKYEAKDFAGVELGEEVSFPVGFVMKKDGTTLFELGDDDKLTRAKDVDKRTFLDFSEETEIRGKAYMVTSDGLLVRKDHVRMPDLQPLPKGLDAWDRWIDVDISKQLLVAYSGTRPVFVTLVSTGRKGSEEEPFDTPEGRWRVYSKQVTSNMDGTTASDGNYAIQDVPWVMYFEGSYALHGAFWHRSFGHVRSHGCVNLGPSDARWLFMWTTPFLPEGWHGVHQSEGNPGTTVVVRKSEK